MSQTTTVRIQARRIALLIRSFQFLVGDRPVMIAYKLGQIRKALLDLNAALAERLHEYIDPETGDLFPDLGEEEQAAINEIADEWLEFPIPVLTLEELANAPNLQVTDDSVLPYWIECGLVQA